MSGNQFFLSTGFPFSITCRTQKINKSQELKRSTEQEKKN
jgi:hypothetical protein